MIEDKPVTYPGHGGVVFRILGEFKGCDVSTSFFVAKEDIYYSVISTDGEVSWQILKGSLVGIEGLEKLAAGFHVSYGKNSKDGKVREEFKYLIDSVGLECILGGLYLIKYGESAAEKSMGFEIICLHFAEAVRFNTICEWVMNALIKGQKLLLPTNIRSFVRSWQSISSVMRLAMLEPEKYTRRELIQRLNKFDVKNEEDLNKFWDHVMIIHRETEKHRKSRREKERAKHNQPPLSSTVQGGWDDKANEKLKKTREMLLNTLVELSGKKDIWSCIKRIFKTHNEMVARSIAYETDMTLVNEDFSHWKDDKGKDYCIQHSG
ncbi:uncharacterized protein [Spinacia oleracea]|uniref:rRNA N-glycosylase n=1 Tax=Spinacia oleracea TaxID=3562 RepID=A0A9R0JWG1_SPIOL|nr:uncharacterized protein LOC110788746 isoform X2 [Spinacia oleracea]